MMWGLSYFLLIRKDLSRNEGKEKKMKKLLIASLMIVASHSTLAADNKATNKPDVFAKATQLYEAKNYPAAFAEMQRLAESGNAQAIYNLGSMTQHGQGTNKDEKKALQYYQDASNKGFGKASFVIAQAYRQGNLGLSKDTQKFKEYLDKASKQGSEEAIVEIATLLFTQGKPETDQIAIRQLRPLIQKNYYPAMHIRAIYDLGQGVKNKNPVTRQQAIRSIQSLAEKGYAPSLMALGNMLANGDILQQNLPEAKKIFTELARQGIPQAKESLAKVEQIEAQQKQAKASGAKP